MQTPVRPAWRALRRTIAGPDYPPRRTPARWPRAARYAQAVLLGLTVVLCALNAQHLAAPHGWALPVPVAWLVSVVGVGPLAVLAARPLWAWRLAFLGLFTAALDSHPDAGWPYPPVQVVVLLAVLATVAVRAGTGVLAWIAAFTLLPVVALATGEAVPGILLLLVAVLLLGHLAGGIRRSRRALAEQTEVSEREKAHRAVLEERARIAREMHDVVAHHMSMIAVQAESAPYRLDDLAEPARTEFAAIADAARQTLADMRRLLGVLRSESAHDPRTAPQPGFGDLPTLVSGARRAGMAVHLDLDTPSTAPPDTVGLTAYRIVQEALANAARHAPAAAVRVTVAPDADGLAVRVVNDPPDRSPTDRDAATTPGAERTPHPGTGHGLMGMRERVRSLGGQLIVGRTENGGFQVTATLPYGTGSPRE